VIGPLLLISAALLSGPGAWAQAPELIHNPSMELDADTDGWPDGNPSMELDADTDGWPDGWRTSADVEYKSPSRLGDTPYVIERSGQAHSGQWCLHYKAAEITPPSVPVEQWWDLTAWQQARASLPRGWAMPIITNRFTVMGETEYQFSMWIKAVGARKLHLKYIGHYASSPEEKTHWTQPLLKSPTGETHSDGSWEWQLFQTKLFVPGEQNWGRLEVWLWQDGQPCELWVDDVSARMTMQGGDRP